MKRFHNVCQALHVLWCSTVYVSIMRAYLFLNPLVDLCGAAMARLNDLYDKMDKLKHMMTVSLEKVAKGSVLPA